MKYLSIPDLEIHVTIDVRMTAYLIKGAKSGFACAVPHTYFNHLSGLPFNSRWDQPLQAGFNSRNLTVFKWLPPSNSGRGILHGRFVEIKVRDSIPMIDVQLGTDYDLQVPTDKAEKFEWEFVLVPDFNLLILEKKGRGGETKLEEFLNSHLSAWSQANPTTAIDAIHILAIPKEDDPIGFLRNNPNLGMFEAKLKAKSISGQEYGVLGGLFRDLVDDENDELRIKIEVTSGKRGGQLPTVVVSHLADFLASIDETNILHAASKQVRSGRATKLLNAIVETSVTVSDRINVISAFVDFSEEVISELGDQLKEEVV